MTKRTKTVDMLSDGVKKAYVYFTVTPASSHLESLKHAVLLNISDGGGGELQMAFHVSSPHGCTSLLSSFSLASYSIHSPCSASHWACHRSLTLYDKHRRKINSTGIRSNSSEKGGVVWTHPDSCGRCESGHSTGQFATCILTGEMINIYHDHCTF